MADAGTVKFRILRDSTQPPSAHGSAVAFGLQDNKDQIYPPVQHADGMLVFEFELKVKEGPDPGRPVFTGLFASGPRDERFVYLSWPRLDGQGYEKRVKIRVTDIGWPLIREAQHLDRRLEYDASNRGAGGGRVAVEWKIGEN